MLGAACHSGLYSKDYSTCCPTQSDYVLYHLKAHGAHVHAYLSPGTAPRDTTEGHNFPEEDKPLIKVVITHLLAKVYGINLKWEPSSPESVTWGEATICFTDKGTSLTRKGVVYSLDNLTPPNGICE